MNTLEVIILPVMLALIASSGAWAFLQYLLKRKDDRRKEEDTDGKLIKTALKGLLHQEIIAAGKTYEEKGKITHEELDDFMVYLYDPYKALEGDGIADQTLTMLKDLPH